MKKIPTVYYGGIEFSTTTLNTPVENLLTHLKRTSKFKEDDYFKCPSFISWASKTLVMKSPADIEVKGSPEGYVQWFEGQYYFFADDEVNMTQYPPFMEETNVRGVVAQFDISKWFRPINPVSALDDNGSLLLKQDQPVLYIGFDREVNLQKVIIPKSLENVMSTAMAHKKLKMKNRTLEKLYDNFIRARGNKVVLKQIKDYNDL